MDDRCVPGGDLKQIADLVGFEYEPPRMLTPAELYAKFDFVLESAVRYIRQIPQAALEETQPDRDRTLRALAFHIVSIARVFLKAYDEDARESWQGIGGTVPQGMDTSQDLARYGDETRRMLGEWWNDVGQHDPMDERVLETYWGAHTVHEAFERETWHTTQHTRQVLMWLEQLGVQPDRPLTKEDMAGLPLPERVWD